ncbi:MAG: hypothetical protein M1829_006177 [Trizodia sp. TS-e1964]|nr:MAG: hypothetical protein M1829_006177 [Trizodia sp. TS-e1964]
MILRYLIIVLNLYTFQPAASATIISTITITAAAPSATPDASFSSADDFQAAVLTTHNVYRQQHNASDLAWNATLAAWGNSWASSCVFKHSRGPSGENLAAGYSNASASVAAWGDERQVFDFENGGFSEETGHFTQVVWKASQTIGCARVLCDGQNRVPGWYVICNYFPPGNVEGGYRENVQQRVQDGEGADREGTGYIQGAINAAERCRGLVVTIWIFVVVGILFNI